MAACVGTPPSRPGYYRRHAPPFPSPDRILAIHTWDLIICFLYLDRPLLPRLAAALAPGGQFVFCQPTRRNLERHPLPRATHLVDEGEARSFAAGLDILAYEEGWGDEGRHVARLVARRSP